MPANPWDLTLLAAAFLVAAVAGAMNSIAGGGTILTFPILLALGLSPKVANITSTLGLWPGSLGGAWGYRHDMAHLLKEYVPFFAISFVGGGVGAGLLLWTAEATFDYLVPWLILSATGLFMFQGWLASWLQRRAANRAGNGVAVPASTEPVGWKQLKFTLVILCQALVAVYGGYFGAGIGILMLALLGFLGLRDLFQMNGIKNLGALCINGVSILLFTAADLNAQASGGDRRIVWPVVMVMAIGAILGAYYSTGVARRVGPRVARWIIIAIGLGGAAWTAWRTWNGG
jgi:uncharacterized membrane protein YfcA